MMKCQISENSLNLSQMLHQRIPQWNLEAKDHHSHSHNSSSDETMQARHLYQ